MNSFHVEYTERAIKDLIKLDRYTRRMISAWIDKNLEECENPRSRGKNWLVNEKTSGCIREGNYRLICYIQDDQLLTALHA